MSDRKYNGWTNYETWVVALWMDNDQGSQEFWAERAQEVWEETEASRYQTREENAAHTLADCIKEHHDNEPEEAGFAPQGVYADLLSAALSEVNWYEIAKNLIDAVEKDDEAR